MDPQQLIAMIELDKQAVVIKQADGTKIKEVVLCKSSELAALIRKYPDLEQYFSVKFVDSLPNKDKPAARRSPTPYPRKSSLTKGSQYLQAFISRIVAVFIEEVYIKADLAQAINIIEKRLSAFFV